jgi:hypothetical protein
LFGKNASAHGLSKPMATTSARTFWAAAGMVTASTLAMSASEKIGRSLQPKGQKVFFAVIQRMAIPFQFERSKRHYATLNMAELAHTQGVKGYFWLDAEPLLQ